jgi:putative lipoprotein
VKGLVLLLSLHAGGDRWIGEDKLKHFLVSAFVESVAYSALRTTGVRHDPALVSAAAIALGVGVGKEVHDARTEGAFSTKDLAWDAAGAGAAAALLGRTR